MSRFFRFVSAIIAAGVLSIIVTAIAVAHDDHGSGKWPTSCIDLNDIVEAHLGRTDNVGIYQRTFGDQAEQACRNDHLQDVRDAFAWAIPASPAETPAPMATTPDSSVRSHHYWAQVRDAALQRGAPQAEAERIADHVIELTLQTNGGQAVAFINGTLPTVAYGIKPPPTPTPTPAPVRQTVSGTGTSAKKINLPQGIYDIHVRWRDNTHSLGGGSNFIIRLLNVRYPCSLLVNEIGTSGSETHFCSLGGTVRIQVEAESRAKWTITFVRD